MDEETRKEVHLIIKTEISRLGSLVYNRYNDCEDYAATPSSILLAIANACEELAQSANRGQHEENNPG